MTSKSSAIVIGGGHNGLVCASYLARSGLDVTLLEARGTLGGGASTHSFADGFTVSSLAHSMYPLHRKIQQDLKLTGGAMPSSHGIDTIALDRDGKHLILGRDAVEGEGISAADSAAYSSFKQEFRAYAAALDPLYMNKPPRLKDMDFADKVTLAKLGWKLRFGLGADSMAEFLRVGGINIYDVLNEVFEDPRLKGAIAVDAVMGHHMGPRTPTTVLTYLNHLRGETHGDLGMPVGGMGSISSALAQTAEECGVDIRTAARVAEIRVEDGHILGVKLDNGEALDADMVISSADAKTTFLKLIAPEQMDAMFRHRIHTSRSRGNVAKLHLALKKLPTFTGLDEQKLSQRLLIAPDMRYVEHAFNHAKYGEYSQHPIMDITIPSLTDANLAPPGQHVMSLSASFAPYNLKGGWDDSKDAFQQVLIDNISQYAPDIQDLVIAAELLTPADIESEFNVSGGHWHHGEMAIDQMFMMRPIHGAAQYDTPIDGLFLCGAAAHPGGGITGIPGYNAARRVAELREQI